MSDADVQTWWGVYGATDGFLYSLFPTSGSARAYCDVFMASDPLVVRALKIKFSTAGAEIVAVTP